MPKTSTEEQLACVRLFLMGKTWQQIDRMVFGIDAQGGIAWEVIPELLDRVHREIRRRGRGGTSTPLPEEEVRHRMDGTMSGSGVPEQREGDE